MRRGTRRAAPMLIVLGSLLAACSQGGLDPRGDGAERILDVFWALLIGAGVVTLVVLATWAWGALRTGDDDRSLRGEHVPDTALQRRFVIGGGIVMPAVVLAVFFGVQIASTVAQPQDGEMAIEVTGHRYWWEIGYRDVDGVAPFETANQLHVPTDTQVTLRLRASDVIHSIWVPQLAGKMDLVPGRETRMVFSAEEPGTYAGYCAEYCGLQHAWMKFEVVAMEPAAFQDWAEQQAEPAPEPGTELQARGREVFLEQSCVGCHTIRGVADDGEIGPDLTHLASRSEIGAGILELTEGSLAAFVANAQAIKPGVSMPPQELSEEQLDALVAYLLSLE